jgi:hypothetical protein
MTSKKYKPMLPREKRFFKNLIAGMGMRQAAIAAGYSPSSATNMATHVAEKYKNKWANLLEKEGLDEQRIARKLSEGMDATKVIGYLHNYKKDADGKIEKAKPDETVSNEFLEVPDHQAIVKYMDMVLTLRDDYPAQNIKHGGDKDNPIAVSYPRDELIMGLIKMAPFMGELNEGQVNADNQC